MQGGKDTVDTLLLGKDSDTWWKAVVNELGRLANGINNQVWATIKIEFIKKEEVPAGLTVTYLFNFPHAFHIYNKQGKKETTDTLLLGKDSDTLWKAVGNELVRLANGIDNRVRATKTIKFIKKEEVPAGLTVTYANFLCDYRPQNKNYTESD